MWDFQFHYGDPAAAADAAGELEELGYTALWLPDVGGDVFSAMRNLLNATRRATVATGILNMWLHTPEQTAAERASLPLEQQQRLMLGIGASHDRLVKANNLGSYDKPYSRMVAYLDRLDAETIPVPKESRMLAALGPRMIALADARTAGVHPYFVPPEHTQRVRQLSGPDSLIATEQAVVLEDDPGRARALARAHMASYLTLPNYRNNLLRLGFDEDDLDHGGSDRLVDAIVVWGDERVIADRIQAHRDAGANHVCIQALREDTTTLPMDQLRRLASALLTSSRFVSTEIARPH